ncbi:ADH2-alcohol dehydrogenase II [Fusarium pseudoanthophilum]|uniref:ADH2-alcohol dehydrogenase II n=1 Tax=Fusarium pseudoanthophilum TaxID=48495 RepID=A0A8H5PWP1_9HYPO|nr:ADH2-alcohol dehydrogenase II [Fusarium pseudoanthophilum]
MKAIQIKEFNAPYIVSDVDKPKPKPHQLLIQIKAGGFCHTDCMALKNAFGSKLPFIGAHEPAGVVVEVGSKRYQVAAIDVKQDTLDLAASHDLKPDIYILSTDPAETSMQNITNGMRGNYPGLGATIIATDAPAAFDLAAKLTRKHGTMVLLAQPEKGITLSYQNVIFRDIKLIGSLVADTDETEELLELVVKHNIQVKIKEWKLEDAEEMRQEYLTGENSGKNVIVF